MKRDGKTREGCLYYLPALTMAAFETTRQLCDADLERPRAGVECRRIRPKRETTIAAGRYCLGKTSHDTRATKDGQQTHQYDRSRRLDYERAKSMSQRS